MELYGNISQFLDAVPVNNPRTGTFFYDAGNLDDTSCLFLMLDHFCVWTVAILNLPDYKEKVAFIPWVLVEPNVGLTEIGYLVTEAYPDGLQVIGGDKYLPQLRTLKTLDSFII